MTIIEIDGSILEGGGQLMRISIGLSALLKKSIRIKNIRAGRSKPGLKAQHMCGLKLVQRLAGGKLEGCVMHSTELTYIPEQDNSLEPEPRAKQTKTNNSEENQNKTDQDSTSHPYQKEIFEVDIGTNGATTLLSQVALPVALFRNYPTILELKGGTNNADTAPPVEYYQHVFLPHLQHFGINFECNILKRSYNNPKGGGHLQLKIKPLMQALPPITLLKARNHQKISYDILAFTSNRVHPRVAQEIVHGASNVLKSYGDNAKSRTSTTITTNPNSTVPEVRSVMQHFDNNLAVGNGSSVLIKANVMALEEEKPLEAKEDTTKAFDNVPKQVQTCLAASSDGSPKINPSKTGAKAARELLEQLNFDSESGFVNVLDQHAQDQLIIFMALACGKSQIECGPLTLHTKTAIYICELLTSAKFKVSDVDKNTVLIECQGIGYYSNHNNT